LPDALRWLWRDYPRPISGGAGAAPVERHFISEILDPGRDWEPVGGSYQATDAPAVDRDGNVYFSDSGASVIYKAATNGKVTVFRQDTGGVSGLMFGADGRLYAVEGARKRVVAYQLDGGVNVL